MAEYQHASDWIPGTSTPYSGVIRTSDGKFIPCQATVESQDWVDYLAWAAIEGNVTDPYLAPAAGGVAVVVPEGEEPVGTMNDSLPLVPGAEGPPVMVDVPAVTGTGVVGEELTCTMGNWDGEPTFYDYRWISQLVDPLGVGDTPVEIGTGDTYVVTQDDVGRTIFCTVTATNTYGSTRAPVGTGIVATEAAGAAAEAAQAPEENHHTRRSHHRERKEEE